jgi:prepilin-type N-terminal cleavage/methylation domain-containing protein
MSSTMGTAELTNSRHACHEAGRVGNLRPRTAGGRPRRERYAFTLLEMVVVLCLVGAVLSIAWPSVRRTLGKSQLREAAKQVRTQLANARLSAMETGQPQQFRYQPGTGRFVITPLDAPLDTPFDPDHDSSHDSVRPVSATARHSESSTDDCRPRPVQALCGGVVFGSTDVRHAYAEAAITGSELAAPDAGMSDVQAGQYADWSAPIIFYPNGRSADATVRLYGERDFQVEVNLRGVLGTVEVAAPVRVREASRH